MGKKARPAGAASGRPRRGTPTFPLAAAAAAVVAVACAVGWSVYRGVPPKAAGAPEEAASAGCANIRTDAECAAWADAGQCDTNSGYMQLQCAAACTTCSALDAVDASGRTPLVRAVVDGQADTVEKLLAAGAAVGVALHWACALGRLEAVRALLRGGAPVDARDGESKTPLMVASMQGHDGAVAALLAAGAAVEAEDPFGNRALHIASYHGRAEAARLLSGAGAAVEARDAQGVTPSLQAAG